ncbi:universal stress protein [Kitasatospora sp. NPDC127111]|uniref:universal stress protein n=1 Tax=Kitasatospora sp. NPDC127111 TaxID=3345363 RepID=UPI003637D041
MNQSVVVGVDPSEPNLAAVDWAAEEASRRRAELRLLHARSGGAEAAEAQLLDREWTRVATRYAEVTVAAELVDGAPREVLTEAAADAALLVVGARGSGGFPRLLLGSTSLHVAAHAPCPVAVVHAPQAATDPTAADPAATDPAVVVGVEGKEHEEPVLGYAFLAARRQSSPLFVVHAWTYPLLLGPGHEIPVVYEESHVEAEHARLLSEVLASWRERFPDVSVTSSVVRSSAAKELVTASAGRHLLVVGRHGEPRGPLGRLGSTSQAVVQHAECPVVVVPV